MRTAIAGALLLLAACHSDAGHPPAKATVASTDSLATMATDPLMRVVLPAATVASAVRAKPTRGDSILAANGYTVEGYEATLYQIAADSAASRFFESALGR